MGVRVGVDVAVGVRVLVALGVLVAVGVRVTVAVGVGVDVGGGGKSMGRAVRKVAAVNRAAIRASKPPFALMNCAMGRS